MNRAVNYLKERFNLDDTEVFVVYNEIENFRKIDNAENMLFCHDLESLAEENESTLLDLWDEYEDLLTCDCGELEWEAIKKVYGEDVVNSTLEDSEE